MTMRATDPISPIASSSGKEDRVLGVTNDDDFSKLDVKIDPHIRLNLSPTSPFISQSAVTAVINAVSGFATIKLREHFRQEYGNKYVDHVKFEAISVESFSTTGGRKLRALEREETALENASESEIGITETPTQLRNLMEAENNVQEEFGTSIVLGGSITFTHSPPASPDECNAILFQTMQRYWGITEWIKMEHQEEFEELEFWNGIWSELVPGEPSVSPTDLPTEVPTQSPTTTMPKPTLVQSTIPTLVASDQQPSASPSISNEVVIPISLEGGTPQDADGGGRDTLLITILSAVGALLLIVVLALKCRRSGRQSPPVMQRRHKSHRATTRRGKIGGMGNIEEGTRIGTGSGSGSICGCGSVIGYESDNDLMCSCIG